MGVHESELNYQQILSRYKGMYDAQCEQMQESFDRMDQLLSREIGSERELLEDDIAAGRLEGWKVLSEETYDMEGEEIVFGSARFRRLMRRSNLVTIMTYFESSFSEVTTLLLKEVNNRRVGTAPGLRLRDFGHKNACHTCRIALTRYVGISDDQSLWSHLQDFVKVRNVIVHQGGLISMVQVNEQYVPEDRSLTKIHQKLAPSGLFFLGSGEVIVAPELLSLLLSYVQTYLCDILDRASDYFAAPKAVKS